MSRDMTQHLLNSGDKQRQNEPDICKTKFLSLVHILSREVYRLLHKLNKPSYQMDIEPARHCSEITLFRCPIYTLFPRITARCLLEFLIRLYDRKQWNLRYWRQFRNFEYLDIMRFNRWGLLSPPLVKGERILTDGTSTSTFYSPIVNK